MILLALAKTRPDLTTLAHVKEAFLQWVDSPSSPLYRSTAALAALKAEAVDPVSTPSAMNRTKASVVRAARAQYAETLNLAAELGFGHATMTILSTADWLVRGYVGLSSRMSDV